MNEEQKAQLNKLTTQADNFYTIFDANDFEGYGKAEVEVLKYDLKVFMDELVDFLEDQGGKANGVHYADGR